MEARAWLNSIDHAIWAPLPHEPSKWRARGRHLARMVMVLGRDLVSGELTMRSMSLVYTTLLSIVPLLALSFSVLKGLGVHNQLEPMLAEMLAPLGAQSEEITRHIIEFINAMNVGVLGSVGLALLLYTAISLVQKIEESFNYVWHVKESRGLSDRFSRYLSVLLVGPVLIVAAMGITASILNHRVLQQLAGFQPIGTLIVGLGKLLPILLVAGAFAFIYSFIPNTRVRVGPALIAGAVGGVLWQSAGWLFAVFVASSGQYAAIYSSFAVLILFLIWLYWSWLVLLFGAAVAFYCQHPEYLLREPGALRLSDRMHLRLALVMMTLIIQDYRSAGPGWSAERFAERLRFPIQPIEEVLVLLERGGLLARTSDEPAIFLPARDPSSFELAEALRMVRAAGENTALRPEMLRVPDQVDELEHRVEDAIVSALRGVRVSDLAGSPVDHGIFEQDESRS